jgi:hypothetical protein
MAMVAMAEIHRYPIRDLMMVAMLAMDRNIAAIKASPWHFQTCVRRA